MLLKAYYEADTFLCLLFNIFTCIKSVEFKSYFKHKSNGLSNETKTSLTLFHLIISPLVDVLKLNFLSSTRGLNPKNHRKKLLLL